MAVPENYLTKFDIQAQATSGRDALVWGSPSESVTDPARRTLFQEGPRPFLGVLRRRDPLAGFA
jgi:hypothetical protein